MQSLLSLGKTTAFKMLSSSKLVHHVAGNTVKNTAISLNFLVWKFCERQFLHSFGRFAQNYVETVPFHKISTPGD